MKMTTVMSTAAAPLATAAIVLATATTAAAANPTVAGFGTREQLFDAGMVTGYTVSNIRPSTDSVPYPVHGRRYEATATVESDQGTITPVISNFNARAADGENYRALFNVATPQGVNPAALAQGARTTGKIYFDVTGATPNSVVYNDGVQDVMIWNSGGFTSPAAPPVGAPGAPGATRTSAPGATGTS